MRRLRHDAGEAMTAPDVAALAAALHEERWDCWGDRACDADRHMDHAQHLATQGWRITSAPPVPIDCYSVTLDGQAWGFHKANCDRSCGFPETWRITSAPERVCIHDLPADDLCTRCGPDRRMWRTADDPARAQGAPTHERLREMADSGIDAKEQVSSQREELTRCWAIVDGEPEREHAAVRAALEGLRAEVERDGEPMDGGSLFDSGSEAEARHILALIDARLGR